MGHHRTIFAFSSHDELNFQLVQQDEATDLQDLRQLQAHITEQTGVSVTIERFDITAQQRHDWGVDADQVLTVCGLWARDFDEAATFWYALDDEVSQ